jgi:hypothetical protein
MKPSTKLLARRGPGRKAILYTVGKSKTIELTLPVATPAEIRRSLNLSRTAQLRVERAIAKAGLRRKTG